LDVHFISLGRHEVDEYIQQEEYFNSNVNPEQKWKINVHSVPFCQVKGETNKDLE